MPSFGRIKVEDFWKNSMKKQNTQLLRRAAERYHKEILHGWKYSVSITLCIAVGTTLVFYIPALVIAAIIARDDSVTLAHDWPYLFAFGGAWILGEALWRLAFFLMARFETIAIKRLYADAMQQLIKKDISFFNDRFAGSITKNLLSYARRFEAYFDTLMFNVASQLGPAIFGAIVLTIISPLLSITLFAIIITTFLLILPLIKKRSILVAEREQLQSVMSGHVSDVVSNMHAVKSFGAEKRELHIHEGHTRRLAKSAYRSWQYHNMRIDMVVSPMYVAVNVLGLAIILMTGVDASTKAQLFLAFTYFQLISRFMWEFNSIYRNIESALSDAGMFAEYADHRPKILDASHATTLSVTSGDITFENIAFSHKKDGFDGLFKDFTLTIPGGQRVGVVGHSGAGKSTLVNLMLRFVDVDSGEIKIDGQSLMLITQESLHTNLGFVPQEPALFHRSLRDNIAYGKPHASESEIIDAAKQAHAWDFIKDLPDGLDTLVGERGVKLSGGQRQRIAIARAILKDAPILILDEATSALDSESEKLIQASLETLMKGRTSIVIAHRLSTISKLDRIIVIEDGRIIEDGSHIELLAKNGTYAKLWAHQSGGFLSN